MIFELLKININSDYERLGCCDCSSVVNITEIEEVLKKNAKNQRMKHLIDLF